MIPPYSLMWVMMVYDYLMHTGDAAFVHERLNGVRAVLDWYQRHELANGLVGPTPLLELRRLDPRMALGQRATHRRGTAAGGG